MMDAVPDPIGFLPTDADENGDESTSTRCRRQRPLRILHLGRVGYIGGAEKILLTLAGTRAARGFETFLACPPGPLADAARERGLEVALIPFSRMKITVNPFKYITYVANRAASARKLVALCRAFEIDVLHAHHPVTALYCERAVRQLNLPLVLHLHEGPPGRPVYGLALRRAARLASKVICVSSAGIALLKASRARLADASVVHNGVSLPGLPARGTVTARATDEVRIAMIGVIEPRKGQDIFVEAIAAIAATTPGLCCFIIGDMPASGAHTYKQKLKDRVRHLGLDREIAFVPYTPNMIERMSEYDIVVSSSVGLESLGFVLLEAMTQGRVVVATKVGGIDDVIEHGQNGFLVEPGCPLSLAQGIREAIACDRVAVGRAAEAIKPQFSVEAMCAEVDRVYGRLDENRARG